MGRLVRWIDRRFYPEYADNWDDDLFRLEILQHLPLAARVLDLGAGAGKLPQMSFKAEAARVCGIDPDESVLRNPYLHEARVAGGEEIPYPDESFDVVFADNVLEHLEDPAAVFREIARVLVPGGVFLAKTPNKRHYVPFVARWTPHAFHQWLNRVRGRAEEHTFPTLYRSNSRGQISRAAAASDLTVLRISHLEGRPEYLRLSGLTYLVGLVYERLVNAVSALAPFRVLLIVVLKKPELEELEETLT